jgi:integrase
LTPSGADMRRSNAAATRFSRCKNRWGFGPELVFHGFRAAFITKLESAQVPQNIAESIVGHARQSMSFGLYSKGADLAVLRDAVEKVSYAIRPAR